MIQHDTSGRLAGKSAWPSILTSALLSMRYQKESKEKSLVAFNSAIDQDLFRESPVENSMELTRFCF